jgi:hypothetical protein
MALLGSQGRFQANLAKQEVDGANYELGTHVFGENMKIVVSLQKPVVQQAGRPTA